MSTLFAPPTLAARGPGDLTLAWTIELDRLELDVIRAERGVREDRPLRTDDWRPPSSIGPIPPGLVARARDLRERQERCLDQMAERLGGAARQHALTVAVSRATVGDGVPVYVDVPL